VPGRGDASLINATAIAELLVDETLRRERVRSLTHAIVISTLPAWRSLPEGLSRCRFSCADQDSPQRKVPVNLSFV